VVGIALNGRDLADRELQDYMAQVTAETGLPCTDTVRFGAEPLLAAVLGHGSKSA
jgi:uncharacterized NAD-dependent epimerase/dehydratase family protein